MARKRIKTLAHEWNVPVEDVLTSIDRLKLGHAHSESSLLTPEEAERIRTDLEQQANRVSALRRETVVETSAGKVVEKRLTATVVRRRHAEAEPAASAAPAEEPFHFEPDEVSAAPFISPFGEEPPSLDLSVSASGEQALSSEPIGLGAFLEPEIPPVTAPTAQAIEAAAAAAPLQAEPAAAAPARLDLESATKPSEPHLEVQKPAPAAVAAEEAAGRARQPGAGRPAGPTMRPTVQVISPERRVINLTGSTHASAPSLDDRQQGPKVLGKIDLTRAPARPATGVRPAPATRPGQAGRPAQTGRFAPAPPAPAPVEEPAAIEPATGKPGLRQPKKKRVIRKNVGDVVAEREIRGLRVPKKRRALPGKEQRKTEITTPKASKRVVRIAEGVTVGDLARNMGVKAAEIIKKLMDLGVMSTLNQMLDLDTATLVASEFGYTVENVAFDVEAAIEAAEEEPGEPVERPPVVTVMGHVDHGKTSLLDAIRNTSVTAEEFGGITQHIGAYTTQWHGRTITFVDTPGHEAFTAMRARGAKVTDIVVLVVAADEGVMPQTVEALNHARAAQVPVIVALNKIDRPEANVERVKQQLSEHELIPEDYGGQTIVVPVSARTGAGIDRLLEMILLQADLMELKADPKRPARGTVIESQLDRGRGPVATVLIQEGTLHQGDPFVCGASHGRVRAMQDYRGRRLESAGPSTPVEIFGLSSVPEPSTAFVAVAEEAKARQVAEFRRSKQREGELQKTSRVSLEHLSERMRAGEVKELKVVLKGDVHGSVEALAEALRRLSTDEVKLDVIHMSAGAVSETDIALASASGAVVIGFNVRPEQKAAALAEKEGVEIRLYTVIYEAIDEMRQAMEGMLAPTYREKAVGRAEIRRTFNVPGGTVAGSMVVDGKVTRGARARLVRDGRVVWTGRVGSLRRFKEDAREVLSGYECGIGLENYNDVKPGDVLEVFELEAVARKLGAPRSEPPVASPGVIEKQLQT